MSGWFWTAPAGSAAVAAVMTRLGFGALKMSAGRWPWFAAVLASAATASLVVSIQAGWTAVPEVVPSPAGAVVRLAVAAALFGVLAATVATDLADYSIPDVLTLPTSAAAVTAAFASGGTQWNHVWADWSQAIPLIRGPAIPLWIAEHPHLHGLAWSVAGAAAGFAVVSAVRWLATVAMGREALGAGDAILMLLVGACLGWQMVLTAVLVAPLLCVVGIPVSKLATGRSFVAYGPYLAAASALVLVFWRPLWLGPSMDANAPAEGLRAVFSDPVLVAVGTATLLFGTALLLGLLRAFRSFPVRTAVADKSELAPPREAATSTDSNAQEGPPNVR